MIVFQELKPLMIKQNNKEVKMPERKTTGSAGYDICTNQDAEIPPHECSIIETGLIVQIPEERHGRSTGRSSLTIAGLHIEGVINEDYRGEVMIITRNM